MNRSRRSTSARRRAARGVTLVEVLIVVAIMAVIAGGATLLAFPEFKKAKIKTAKIGAAAVREAAQTFQEIDGGGSGACPTVSELIEARKLDKRKSDDPWGSPYKITCQEGEIHAVSPGNDRKESTPDDVRDDLLPAEIEAIAKL